MHGDAHRQHTSTVALDWKPIFPTAEGNNCFRLSVRPNKCLKTGGYWFSPCF
ncbi:mCG140274 [Mus musculus]|nr:mCG140274 [Mus musculus]